VSRPWTNFSSDDLEVLAPTLPPFGQLATERVCPACGETSVRWYHYRNTFRDRAKVTYVWCSACRRFYGQTTRQESWELSDPLGELTGDERVALEGDLGTFFGDLDRLWAAGSLPQYRRTGRNPDSRRR
jgi:hypothetical protein